MGSELSKQHSDPLHFIYMYFQKLRQILNYRKEDKKPNTTLKNDFQNYKLISDLGPNTAVQQTLTMLLIMVSKFIQAVEASQSILQSSYCTISSTFFPIYDNLHFVQLLSFSKHCLLSSTFQLLPFLNFPFHSICAFLNSLLYMFLNFISLTLFKLSSPFTVLKF